MGKRTVIPGNKRSSKQGWIGKDYDPPFPAQVPMVVLEMGGHVGVKVAGEELSGVLGALAGGAEVLLTGHAVLKFLEWMAGEGIPAEPRPIFRGQKCIDGNSGRPSNDAGNKTFGIPEKEGGGQEGGAGRTDTPPMIPEDVAYPLATEGGSVRGSGIDWWSGLKPQASADDGDVVGFGDIGDEVPAAKEENKWTPPGAERGREPFWQVLYPRDFSDPDAPAVDPETYMPTDGSPPAPGSPHPKPTPLGSVNMPIDDSPPLLGSGRPRPGPVGPVSLSATAEYLGNYRGVPWGPWRRT